MHGKFMVLDALNSIAIFLLLITVGTGSLFGTAQDVTNWSYACINPHDLSPYPKMIPRCVKMKHSCRENDVILVYPWMYHLKSVPKCVQRFQRCFKNAAFASWKLCVLLSTLLNQ